MKHNGIEHIEYLRLGDSCLSYGCHCSLGELKRSIEAACNLFFIRRGLPAMAYNDYSGRNGIAPEDRAHDSIERQQRYLRRRKRNLALRRRAAEEIKAA